MVALKIIINKIKELSKLTTGKLQAAKETNTYTSSRVEGVGGERKARFIAKECPCKRKGGCLAVAVAGKGGEAGGPLSELV